MSELGGIVYLRRCSNKTPCQTTLGWFGQSGGSPAMISIEGEALARARRATIRVIWQYPVSSPWTPVLDGTTVSSLQMLSSTGSVSYAQLLRRSISLARYTTSLGHFAV